MDARRKNPFWPLVLAEGDSWFSHPIQKNIVAQLVASGVYAILDVAFIGDTLREMVQ